MTKLLDDFRDIATLTKRIYLYTILFVNGTAHKDALHLAKTTPARYLAERVRNTLK